VWNAARELDHFEATSDFSSGIRQHLAVFTRDDAGELIDMCIEERFEAKHHSSTLQRRSFCPGRKRGLRGFDRCVRFIPRSECYVRCSVACSGVVHGRGAARRSADAFAIDEMTEG
jgi:hypothetical protein